LATNSTNDVYVLLFHSDTHLIAATLEPWTSTDLELDKLKLNFSSYFIEKEISVAISFHLNTHSDFEPFGFVLPWNIRTVKTSKWICESDDEFSLIYVENFTDTDEVEFYFKDQSVNRLTYYEYSIIVPMPPVIGERAGIAEIEQKLKELSPSSMLFSVAQKFREEGTIIEVDIPRDSNLKGAYPFYNVGIAESHIFLNWNSLDLDVLGKGSYPSSLLIETECPQLRRDYEQKMFLSGLIIGLGASVFARILVNFFWRGILREEWSS